MSERIYMPLLDEGTDVWRPVEAQRLPDGRYLVLGAMAEGERWRFPPGSAIRCETRRLSDGEPRMVASALVNRWGQEVWFARVLTSYWPVNGKGWFLTLAGAPAFALAGVMGLLAAQALAISEWLAFLALPVGVIGILIVVERHAADPK